MIKKLKKYLGLDKNTLHIAPDLDNNNAFSIVLANPEPLLKISIIETSDDDAKKFANMLYELHQAKYINSIIDVLTSMANKDQTIMHFVKTVLVEWKELQRNTSLVHVSTQHKDPVIKPTHFFKFMRNE